MKLFKAVYLDDIPQHMHDIYGSYATEDIEYLYVKTTNRDEMLEMARNADFFIVSGVGVKMDLAMIDFSPKLKLIHLQGVGFEAVDVDYASSKNIPVCTTPAGTTETVAEYTVMLILAVMRQLVVADKSVRDGKFLIWEFRKDSRSILDKTVGIIGFGRIGRAVAKRLKGFDVHILYYDKYVRLSKEEQEEDAVEQVESLDELASRSDVITVHMPYVPEYEGFINNESLFGKMKPTAFFINTARGKIVKEKDLIETLREKRIAGAGIDVYEKEPADPDNPLFSLPNVILTPHIAGGTRDALMAKGEFMFANMQNLIMRKALKSCINEKNIRGGIK